VLDRTKEPGAQAEPLYLDVMTALAEAFNRGERETLPRVIGPLRLVLQRVWPGLRAGGIQRTGEAKPNRALPSAFMMT
jgi:hypothetical protein